MNEKELFDKSREKWGLTSQLLMISEECSELAVASLHMTRNVKNNTINKQRKTLRDFAKEIADVQFMINEMVYYFKHHPISDFGALPMNFFEYLQACQEQNKKYLEKLLEEKKDG